MNDPGRPNPATPDSAGPNPATNLADQAKRGIAGTHRLDNHFVRVSLSLAAAVCCICVLGFFIGLYYVFHLLAKSRPVSANSLRPFPFFQQP